VGELNDAPTVLTVESELSFFVDMEGHPSTIFKSRQIWSQDSDSVLRFYTTVHAQQVLDHRCFEGTLRLEFDMLKVAPSALVEHGTLSFDAVWRWSYYRRCIGVDEALFREGDYGLNRFAGNRSSDESLFTL
jgi:hypothetical protein